MSSLKPIQYKLNFLQAMPYIDLKLNFNPLEVKLLIWNKYLSVFISSSP